MSQSSQVNLQALWKYVTDQVKAKTTLPSLWRALEAAKPLVVENDQLILGFSTQNAYMAGQLTDNRHKNIIEQVLEAALKRRLQIHVISGDTLEDWEAEKRHREEAARLQQQARQQYQRETATADTWEAVAEQLIRKFTEMPYRGQTSTHGAFLDHAVQTLAEAYGRLMPEKPGEMDERNCSRAIDRLGDRLSLPGSILSYLVYERRQKLKKPDAE